MIQGVCISREGDNHRVKAYLDSFPELTEQEFIDKAEHSNKVGMLGPHGQLVCLRAMNIGGPSAGSGNSSTSKRGYSDKFQGTVSLNPALIFKRNLGNFKRDLSLKTRSKHYPNYFG